MGQCEQLGNEVGTGVAAALRAVDCVASETTSQAFGRLFAPGGALTGVLTILLTLFVALFALALLLGRTNLSVRSLAPRMITLGLVLTFATSWIAYQSVVWNLAIGAPDWLAGVLTGSDGSATQTFADKIDVVFMAIQETTGGSQDFSAFSPPGMMWLGALLFLLGTVGVLVTARIALALLVAIGPIFVVMALFNGTRGLFTGWLKGLVMLALTPIFVVLGGSVMLELAVPILRALTATPGLIDPQAAMAFFLIGAVHVALMLMVLKVSSTMVAGWSVFGIATSHKESANAYVQPTAAASVAAQSAQAPASAITRAPAVTTNTIPAPSAANDSGPASPSQRGPRIHVQAGDASRRIGPGFVAPARVQGIGNRFRNPQHSKTEKFS